MIGCGPCRMSFTNIPFVSDCQWLIFNLLILVLGCKASQTVEAPHKGVIDLTFLASFISDTNH